MKKIVATIEARYASARLPGKTLLKIVGKPTLELLIERLKRSKLIEQIVVATTVNPNCQPIVDLAKKLGVGCFRGSEEDVLDRVLKAAKAYQADIIVEITGDLPLIDPEITDSVIDYYFKNNFDYVSNMLDKKCPHGLDTQIFSVDILEEVSKITNDSADRENVSLYIYEHPEKYKLGSFKMPPEFCHPEWRFTLDTIEDFNFVNEIYERLYYQKSDFNTYDVINLFNKQPQLLEINKHIKQKTVR